MKALERLEVMVLGDSLHTKRAIEKKASKRLLKKEPILRISKPKKRIVYGVKKMRKSVSAEPNAPLLKRIIKYPFVLDIGYMKRLKIMRAKLESRLIYERDTTLQDYLRSDKRVRKMRPMDLYQKAEVRQIPTLEEWLKGKKRT